MINCSSFYCSTACLQHLIALLRDYTHLCMIANQLACLLLTPLATLLAIRLPGAGKAVVGLHIVRHPEEQHTLRGLVMSS